ncbi:MAG: ASCH domain-containing protein [Patescibacteria group bacterium]
MKSLKFAGYLVSPVLSGKKTSTWRMFDDKKLQVGDKLAFVNRETGKEFAQAEIVGIREKKLSQVVDADFVGHEKANSMQELYEDFRHFYGDKVTWETPLKMVDFKLSHG